MELLLFGATVTDDLNFAPSELIFGAALTMLGTLATRNQVVVHLDICLRLSI